VEPYIPDHLPLKTINWEMHVSLIGKAVLSSRIEGTQASLEDVLQYEADVVEPYEEGEGNDTPSARDIHEIINYRKAMSAAVEEMKKRPFGINTIRDLHRILLAGVRGRNKDPGEIRRIQNYIAPPGTPIERATFVPPTPPMIMDALSNWEEYLHSDEKDALVQLAVLKGQFELIHPFLDGNGRIGRMLVPLILYHKGILSSPMFYISAYLERNRDIYYQRLRAISSEEEKDWNGWISFFLNALVEQADENSRKARAILALYNSMKQRVPEITHSQHSIQAIDAIFSRPIFNSAYFIKKSEIGKMTALRILREMKESGILVVSRERRGSRSALYEFSELIDITERDEV
jgi:Fic family protein